MELIQHVMFDVTQLSELPHGHRLVGFEELLKRYVFFSKLKPVPINAHNTEEIVYGYVRNMTLENGVVRGDITATNVTSLEEIKNGSLRLSFYAESRTVIGDKFHTVPASFEGCHLITKDNLNNHDY